MTLDVLDALSDDIDRLVQAGACIAPHDAALQAHRAALAAAAQRVPALALVVTRLDALLAGPPRAAVAAELLALAQSLARVNAARARVPATTGPALAPLAPLPKLRSDVAPEALAGLRAALREPAPGREPFVRSLLANGAYRDARAVGLWLAALDDPYLGELVAAEVIPRFDPGFAGVLRHGLRVTDGTAGDGLRLVCLAALAPAETAALAADAWARGAPPVRGGALRAMVRADPAAHAPRARATLADPAAPEALRTHAARALADARDDGSFEALVAAVSAEREEPAVRLAAARALGAMRHPDAPARLDALLTDAVARVRPNSYPPDPPAELACCLLEGAAAHLTPASAARLARLARTAGSYAVRSRADALLRAADSPLGLEALVAQAGSGAECAELWSAVRPRVEARDGRVVPLLCALVARLDRADRYLAYYALRDLRDPSALPALRARSRQVHTLESTEAYLLVQTIDAIETARRASRRAPSP